MSKNSNSRFRWAEVVEVLLTLGFVFTLLMSFLAASHTVQSTEYGVVLLGVAIAFVTHKFLSVMAGKEQFRPVEVPWHLVEQWRHLIVLGALLLPIIVSWSVNGSLAAAWNPIGYWKSEQQEARKADCIVLRDVLVSSAEQLQVAQNKYRMGIATTSEVTEAAESLKLVSGIHKSCLAEAQAREARATKRLNELTSL